MGKQLKDIIATTEVESGRKFKIEIEPGTFLAGNTGILVTQVIDIVSTGKEGHKFIKLNTGLNDIARPSLYGAQHHIRILKDDPEPEKTTQFVVVGHCCESGDLLTCERGNPDVVKEISLPSCT